MIAFFNKLGNSWVAKIICGILGISMMAFWGLGGLSITGGHDTTVATVDGQDISVNQINKALDAARNKFSTLTGTYISPKQAIQMGLLDQVVTQQVNDLLQMKIQDEIGLTASDEAVRKYVEFNPLFSNNLGQFDANLFYAYLGQMKLTQSELAEKLQSELVQQHFNNAILKSVPRNSKLMNEVAQSQKEQRVIQFVKIDPKQLNVATPTDSELQEYYEAYSEEFTAPEYRTISVLSITPDLFKTDGEQAYNRMYKTVQDLEDLLGEGLPLADAAQKLSIPTPKKTTIDVSGLSIDGQVSDKTLQNNQLVQEAFVLSEGEATSVMDMGNSFMVIEVNKIIPVSIRPFDTVKKQVQQLWKSEQQKDLLPKTVTSLVENLKNKKSWGKYTPQTEVVLRTTDKGVAPEVVTTAFRQNVGMENASTLNINDSVIVLVVKEIISNTSKPSEKDASAAVKVWADELTKALHETYANHYNVRLYPEVVQSAFASYLKEND